MSMDYNTFLDNAEAVISDAEATDSLASETLPFCREQNDSLVDFLIENRREIVDECLGEFKNATTPELDHQDVTDHSIDELFVKRI